MTVSEKGRIQTSYAHSQSAHAPAGAQANVQSDWSATDSSSDAYIKNKPSFMPASDVYSWAKSSSKPSYTWSEIGSRPTKLSQFINDSGFKTPEPLLEEPGQLGGPEEYLWA